MRIESISRTASMNWAGNAAEAKAKRLQEQIAREATSGTADTLTVGPKLVKMAQNVVSTIPSRLTLVVDPKIVDETWRLT